MPAAILSGALLLGLGSSHAQAAVTFSPRTDYNTGTGPRALRSADFNRDGNVDLVTANFNGYSISVLLGNADGTFRPKTDYSVPPPQSNYVSANALAIDDFNRDGKLDVAVTGRDDARVQVLLGDGNGGFGTAIPSASSLTSFSLDSGDFNGDGKPDLASVNQQSNTVTVLLGNGNGTFAAPANYTAGQATYGVKVADFNADGKADLAVANNGANTLSVLFGNGNGTFGSATFYPAGVGPREINTADLNADGKLDMIVGNFGSSASNTASLSVLINNGNGTFGPTANYETTNGSFAGTFAGIAADLDGDGKLDLVSANNNGNTIGVRPGNGNGAFGALTTYAAGAGPRSLVSGDFNKDSKVDLAVAQGNTSQGVGGLGVFLNTTAPAVINTAPVINSVTITPNNPTTNTLLTANVNASDAETASGSLTYTYVWKKTTGGVATTLAETGKTLNLATIGYGDRGDSITVTVTASDGQLSSTAVTSSAVTVQNSNPSASNDTATVAEDSSATIIDVLANDTASPDTGETLTVTAVTQPTQGTVTLTDGVVRFTPTANFNGSDSFTYTINDGNGGTATATVTATVTPVNDNPTGTNDTATVAEDSAATVIDVLANDSASPDTGETLTVTAVTQPTNGTVTLVNGVVRFTPTANFNGNDSFTYTIDDGKGGTATATVNVTVTPGNDAPIISSVSLTPESAATNSTLTATPSATDADGDTLTYTYQWKKGGVAIAGATSKTLDLSVLGNGDKGDSITVSVVANDGTASSVEATSSPVTVGNTAPSLTSVSLSPSNPTTDGILTATPSGSDADNDTLTYSYVWKNGDTVLLGETSNTLNLSQAGNGDNGDQITVTVTANDGTIDSAPKTSSPVTVTVVTPLVTVDRVSLSPLSPKTDGLLTASVAATGPAGVPLTYSYTWKKNGFVILGQSGRTLNLALAGNGDRKDALTVEVVAADGTASSAPLASAPVVVANTGPVVTSVSLSPVNPGSNDVLTATATGLDADNDALSFLYVWMRNGTVIPGESGKTLDLAKANVAGPGDKITVLVKARDLSASSAPATSAPVTVGEDPIGPTLPAISSVSVSPSSPKTNETLTATVTSTGDHITHTFEWRKNGTVIPGETSSTLDLSKLGNGDRGDSITVTVVATDGTYSSTPVTSAVVKVSNSGPSVTAVSLSPVNPGTNDVVTAMATGVDADNDAISFLYVWMRNGTVIPGESGKTLDLAKAGIGEEGDKISVLVKARDFSANSAPTTSAPVTVGASSTPPALRSSSPARSSFPSAGNS